MKFSLNMAQYYSNVDLKTLDREDIIKRMGLQLGAIEDFTDWTKKFEGIVVVRVVSCEKHPDADKLSLCRIDDGGVVQNIERDNEGFVQVVCGAHNVSEGMYVAWIPPGAIVPSTINIDPFVLEARLIRGKISNGMIASPRELDISDDHEGILELSEEIVGSPPKAGEVFSKHFGLDDFVVTCENKMFTHRPDCFGNLGIARELAGIFGLKFESPEWYTAVPVFDEVEDIHISVENNIPELVPRFTAVAMKNIEIKSSPIWVQSYLRRVGIKPINNVVDVTNFIMQLTAQPIHAFDFDKLQNFSNAPSLSPRMAENGEKLTLLGGKEITLDSKDIVIATDKQAVALAGIMGGADTEVDENTKNIIIECANFDMYTIRRSSMRHGLFTEAVTRFNKGQSPLQNDRVLAYAMKNMSELCSAQQASAVNDLVAFDLGLDNLNHVIVDANFINERLGTNLSVETIKQLLQNVEFSVTIQGDTLEVIAPFWRMDIGIREDIVEEVGRLNGYVNIPVVLPAKSLKPASRNEFRDFKNSLRSKLSALGGNEVLTYSFVHADLLKNAGIVAGKWCYHLRNALSPELQFYRPSLTPSLLAKVSSNIKVQAGSDKNEFALFEIGKTHIKNVFDEFEQNLPKQMNVLGFVFSADAKTANKYYGSAYYLAKKYLDQLTDGQAKYTELEDFENPVSSPYLKGRSALVTIGEDELGVIGEYSTSLKKALKLPEYTAGFEINLDIMRLNLNSKTYNKISDFPSTTQDITFESSLDTNWSDIFNLVSAELSVAGAEDNFDYSVLPLSIYMAKNSNTKRISFRVSLTHDRKTLKTEEVNKMLEQIAEAVHEKYKTTRI